MWLRCLCCKCILLTHFQLVYLLSTILSCKAASEPTHLGCAIVEVYFILIAELCIWPSCHPLFFPYADQTEQPYAQICLHDFKTLLSTHSRILFVCLRQAIFLFCEMLRCFNSSIRSRTWWWWCFFQFSEEVVIPSLWGRPWQISIAMALLLTFLLVVTHKLISFLHSRSVCIQAAALHPAQFPLFPASLCLKTCIHPFR